jgi:hypothetical protein
MIARIEVRRRKTKFFSKVAHFHLRGRLETPITSLQLIAVIT